MHLKTNLLVTLLFLGSCTSAHIKEKQKEVQFKHEIEYETKLPANIKTIHFAFNSSKLHSFQKKKLKRALPILKNRPRQSKIMIEGHTDTLGASEYNKLLARKRAQSVKNFLIQQGINKDDVKIQAIGENKPAMDVEAFARHRVNRRSLVKLVKDENSQYDFKVPKLKMVDPVLY